MLTSSVAAQPEVHVDQTDTQTQSPNVDRHKIVAKRGAAFTIMVRVWMGSQWLVVLWCGVGSVVVYAW